MHYNWEIISDKLFGILKGSGYSLTMFDKTGKKIMDPHEATRFFATTKSNDPNLETFSILVSLHDENTDSHLDIKTPNIKDDMDFEKVHALNKSLKKNIGEKEGLKINWYKFDHAIRAKDDAINNITETKDIGKPYGTTKSSFQKVGNSKLIIRHTDTIDESKKGGRWRKIKAIFIENKIGERFNYPYPHIAGARAMARHISNEGRMYDNIGMGITSMSESYYDIKKACKILREKNLSEDIENAKLAIKYINSYVKKLAGPRGYVNLSNNIDFDYDENSVNSLVDKFIQNNEYDDEIRKSLETTAKYIIFVIKQPSNENSLIQKINNIIPGVTDPEKQKRLTCIVDSLSRKLPIDITDINFVKACILDISSNASIERMKKLGGII